MLACAAFALLAAVASGVRGHAAGEGARGRTLLQMQGDQMDYAQALHSMHCFAAQDNVFLAGTVWRPADYYQAPALSVAHRPVQDGDPNSILSSACEGQSNKLEFVFIVPRKCKLKVNLYFASNDASGVIAIHVNGKPLGETFDQGSASAGGTTVHFTTMGPESGYLDIAMLPVSAGTKPTVNGIQVFSIEECSDTGVSLKDTTGEADDELDTGELVYRMSCSAVVSESLEANLTSLETSSDYLVGQAGIVNLVADATTTTGLFGEVCMPASDADHVAFVLNLVQGVTYEAVLYLKPRQGRMWSDVLIAVDGQPAFTTDREMYAMVNATTTVTVMKKVEFRTEQDNVTIAVSSLGGFAPLTGLEVYRVVSKSSSLGKSVLDQPDGYMVIDCGSELYKQTPTGVVVYPGTLAFNSVGLQVSTKEGELNVTAPAHQEFADAGLFHDQCMAAAGESIHATLKVVNGETYQLTFHWAELGKPSKVGERTMNIIVDGTVMAKEVDVLAMAPKGSTTSVRFSVVAKAETMQVEIVPVAGWAFLSFLTVHGKEIDGAAADRPIEHRDSGLVLAAACGAVGDQWQPLDPYLAAGYGKVTSLGDLGTQESIYATQCFVNSSDTLTIQLDVIPQSELRVVLHFTETFFSQPGERTFDVKVNGKVEIPNVDIVRLVGPSQPLVREFTYIPSGHKMVIELVSTAADPVISALEVYALEPLSSSVVIVDGSDPDVVAVSPGAAPPGAAPAAAPAPAPGTAPASAPIPVSLDWTPPDGVKACIPKDMFPKFQPLVMVSPAAVQFPDVEPTAWQQNFAVLRFTVPGAATTITGIQCSNLQAGGPGLTWFVLQFSVQQRVECGGPDVVPVDPPFALNGNGAEREVIALFEPADLGTAGVLVKLMSGTTELGDMALMGNGGNPFDKPHVLHPVVNHDPVFSQPVEMGGATVFLDGRTSHTHDPESKLVAYFFKDVRTEVEVSKTETAECFLPFGTYSFKHTIQDSKMTSESATTTFVVAPEQAVPGMLVHIYGNLESLDPLPDRPITAFMSKRPFTLSAHELPMMDDSFVMRMVGNTTFPGGPVVLKLPSLPPSTLAFLVVDGAQQATTALDVPAGDHEVDIRIKLTKPMDVSMQLGDAPISGSIIDVSTHPPVINELATDSITKANATGLIRGFMLRPPAKLFIGKFEVNITARTVSSMSFTYPDLAPGEWKLTVQRDGLTSNEIPVTIEEVKVLADGGFGGPFGDPKFGQKHFGLKDATRVVFCHGKIYASQAYSPSSIWEITVNDAYDVIAEREVVKVPEPWKVTGSSSWSVLGLACDPRDNDADFKLYFTHSNIYRTSGTVPPDDLEMPYIGSVYMVKPNDPNPEAIQVISSLAVANGDHAVNGIDFHNDGRLLILVGSHTNAGIPGALGWLPENPTSAAVIAADVQNPDFDGKITYSFMDTAPAKYAGLDPTDQKNGDWTINNNPFIKPYATGVRNPFGIRVSQTGKVMVTINGPNVNYGEEMTGVNADMEPTTNKDPQTKDAFFYDLKEDCYAGHPNIARCRNGSDKECKWTSMLDLVEDFPNQCKPDGVLLSALGGIFEYRSYAFGGAWDKRVFICTWKKHMVRWNPADKKVINDPEDDNYPDSASLDVIQGPGGVHIMTGLPVGAVIINYPIDATMASHSNPSLYDINPQKAAKVQTGPNTFIVGGANFDSIVGEVAVLFGTMPATNVTIEGSTWIKGYIPSNPDGTCETDVSVLFGTTKLTMPGIFCYLV